MKTFRPLHRLGGAVFCLLAALAFAPAQSIQVTIAPNSDSGFTAFRADGTIGWQVPSVACPQRVSVSFVVPSNVVVRVCARPFAPGTNALTGFKWGRETFTLGTFTGTGKTQSITSGTPFAGAEYFLLE